MHILSEEEALQTNIIKQGRNSLLRKNLLTLKVGQVLFLPNKEWQGAHPPYHIARRIAAQTEAKFDYGRKPDGTGWLFKRVS
jgi:hypothetical protein